MDAIDEIINNWKSKGQYFNYKGHRIWYLDYNASKENAICVLHGYPTCSYDFKNVLNQFSNYRVIIHDHLGFGLSDKPVSSKYQLQEQADIAIALYSHLQIKKMILIAHDYGTSVATEIIARDNNSELNFYLDKIILSNGSMLIDMSKLRTIQRILKNKYLGPLVAKLATRNTFVRNMKNISYDRAKMKKEDLKVLWRLLVCNGGRKVLPKITQYIDQRYTHYERWIGALKKTSKSVLILWGEDDPVAIVEMSDVLESYISNSKRIILPQTGHYPMLENPDGYCSAITNFINTL